MSENPIIICTRGSALALAQSNMIAALCRAAFPELQFELQIIKTTGDKLQKASMAKTDPELPEGLYLAATPKREDVRDVLIYRAAGSAQRGFKAHATLKDFPPGATIAT